MVDVVKNNDPDSNSSDSEGVFSIANRWFGRTRSTWCSTILAEKRDVTFKLDTGVEASVLPAKVYHSMYKTCIEVSKCQVTCIWWCFDYSYWNLSASMHWERSEV